MLKLFDFECVECKTVFERLYADGENVHCPLCNSTLVEKLPPLINVAMGVGAYGYFDETLGVPITTNAQRKAEMRKQGVTPKGETPKPEGDAWF